MKNRLENEKSLYLKQHAKNPVQWLSIRDNPFELASKEGKPVFLSIGYSACHWCHVMAREAFSNSEVADYLNRYFIPVKADREEYPDIDKKYQFYLQIIRANGGWPLSVFTDANGIPFYGGTYFPVDENHGLPGFIRILKTVKDFFDNDPERLSAIKENYRKILLQYKEISPEEHDVKKILKSFETGVKEILDFENGGLKGNNKFPNIPTLLALLEPSIMAMPGIKDFLKKTADAICTKGLCDHMNGGFFRYCVDTGWGVPHFEKMLYDNALNVIFLARMFSLTENPIYLYTANHTLEFLMDEFFTDNGFISSMNAESPDKNGQNTEGYYYIADEETFRGIKTGDAELITGKIYMTEGVINFHNDISHEDIIAVHNLLRNKNKNREKPASDNKIILSWNALLSVAMFEFFEASADDFYLNAGMNLLNKILTNFTDGSKFYRIRYDDALFEHSTLEDFAFILYAVTKAHSITKDKIMITRAKNILENAISGFCSDGVIYYDRKHEIIETFDEAVFSAVGIFIESCSYLKDYIDEDVFSCQTERFLIDRFNKYPMAHPTFYRIFKKKLKS